MMGRGARPGEAPRATPLRALAARLVALRGARRPAVIASAVSLAPVYYSQIELGRKRPTEMLLRRLAALYRIDPGELLALLPPPPPKKKRPPAVDKAEAEDEPETPAARATSEEALDARATARLLAEDETAALLAKAVGWRG